MSKPKLLDLYCGAGGAAVGYNRAGFEVVGVDINPQPNYPFEFIQSDVFNLDESFLDEFDSIHASPPCQAYSKACNIHRKAGKEYPDLIPSTRKILKDSERPYIIENVTRKTLIKPLMLCGTMFNLRVLRHRLFEIGNTDAWIYPPCGCRHNGHIATNDYVCVVDGATIWGNHRLSSEEKQASKKQYNEYLKNRYFRVVGRGGGIHGSARFDDWCDAMGIDWMTHYKTITKNRRDLTQAIPPAYTEWIGKLIIGAY